jgi:hypothetical protein
MSMEKFRSQFVPADRFRFWLSIFFMLVYMAMGTAVQLDVVHSAADVARVGGMRVGALVLLFLVGAALTDYLRRPWRIRLLYVGAGMLAYALVAWPFMAWIAALWMRSEQDVRMARSATAMCNTMAGWLLVSMALHATRLMAVRPKA